MKIIWIFCIVWLKDMIKTMHLKLIFKCLPNKAFGFWNETCSVKSKEKFSLEKQYKMQKKKNN